MKKSRMMRHEILKELLMINFILIFSALAAAALGAIFLSYLFSNF